VTNHISSNLTELVRVEKHTRISRQNDLGEWDATAPYRHIVAPATIQHPVVADAARRDSRTRYSASTLPSDWQSVRIALPIAADAMVAWRRFISTIASAGVLQLLTPPSLTHLVEGPCGLT